MNRKTLLLALYLMVFVLAIASLAISYGGMAGAYDTEPLLAMGLLLLAVAGLSATEIRKKV